MTENEQKSCKLTEKKVGYWGGQKNPQNLVVRKRVSTTIGSLTLLDLKSKLMMICKMNHQRIFWKVCKKIFWKICKKMYWKIWMKIQLKQKTTLIFQKMRPKVMVRNIFWKIRQQFFIQIQIMIFLLLRRVASKENVISNILLIVIGWPMTFPKIGFFVIFAKKAWEKNFWLQRIIKQYLWKRGLMIGKMP